MSMRESLTAVILFTGPVVLAGCSQLPATAPSAPPRPLASSSGGGATAGTLSADIVFDSDATGTAFKLTSFDGVTLTGTNAQGSFTAVLDSSSILRNAHLNTYAPVDPCRELAVNYNAAGTSSDSGVTTAISELVAGGCVARVLVDKGTGLVPPNPIKSFRPIPAF